MSLYQCREGGRYRPHSIRDQVQTVASRRILLSINTIAHCVATIESLAGLTQGTSSSFHPPMDPLTSCLNIRAISNATASTLGTGCPVLALIHSKKRDTMKKNWNRYEIRPRGGSSRAIGESIRKWLEQNGPSTIHR